MGDETREALPIPPFPDPLSPMLALIAQEALDAFEAGELDIAGAITHAAVNAWMEGHLEGEECDGCDVIAAAPDRDRLRDYKG